MLYFTYSERDKVGIFRSQIAPLLDKQTCDLYYECGGLHDWLLTEIFCSNTGMNVLEYSDCGSMTVQLRFWRWNQETVLIYRNVSSFQVEQTTQGERTTYFPLPFGEFILGRFDILNGNILCHGLRFAEGTIEIQAEDMKLRRIKMPCK